VIQRTAIGAAATQATSKNPLDQLKSAAQGFEAVFARQMIKSMRSASLGDGLLDSDSSKQFQDISDSNLADDMAKKGSFGIAEMLVKQFKGHVAAGAAQAGDAAKVSNAIKGADAASAADAAQVKS
jgi:flagellar protein FlgJ